MLPIGDGNELGESMYRTVTTLALASILTAGLAGKALAADYFEGFGFYLGELHSHTGASGDGGSSDLGICDGVCGPALPVADNAAQYGLDFITYTDHVNGGVISDSAAFMVAQQAIREAHDPDGGLVTLQAGELFLSLGGEPLGHKNLYFFADNQDLTDLTMEDIQFDGAGEHVPACFELWEWMAQMEQTWGPVLLLPHHVGMAGGMGTEWSCHQEAGASVYAPAVEIYSEHGDSSFADTTFDPLWMGADSLKTVEGALDPAGWALRLGFVGGTDQHDSHPGSVCSTDTEMPHHPYGGGLTIAVVPDGQDFDRGALYDAITERRTYATSGPLLPAIVEYWGDGTYLGGMGEELDLDGFEELSVEVRVPEVWDAFVSDVMLVGPDFSGLMDAAGDGVFESASDTFEVPEYLYPLLIVDGASWYGDDGCGDAGDSAEERIWLSPTWFTPGGPGPDDDDDTTAGDDDTTGDDDDTTGDDDDTTGDDDADDDDTGGGYMQDPDGPGSCRCAAQAGSAPLGALALTTLLAGVLLRYRPRVTRPR